ncbi:GMP/IMP nucleotidase [Thalassotalea mangrovi]|uniref:GMP/IMP nucleotidase n=1 Tax=Thalassotalea mangrovi TaxID=2572245 RepID=A0A4V5NUH8_9GAMM|nr:GMP/IMP nucleotidase [Thalassotalea mangrovi]TKB45475.1 GMP/IMP nucleotidase [Thalassotalea mangrovi]
MFNWAEIDTVLLDMDGTLLDLHYDNHFWKSHLPTRYAQHHDISEEDAHKLLSQGYQDVAGTIDWYCLDYWADKTQLPIVELKKEVQHLIQMRDDAHDFLIALKKADKDVILVTNAHPDALALKIERTGLDKYFDQLISTHQFGVTKESQLLWQRLHEHLKFDKSRTLFVDDSLPILKSAQMFGIAHLLAIANPDSKLPSNSITDFPAIEHYQDVITDIC